MKIEVKLIIDISGDHYDDLAEATWNIQYALSDTSELFLHSNVIDNIGIIERAELIKIE